MTKKTILASLLTLIGGVTIGWVDLHASEVQVPVALLLAFGLMIGLLRPARAWAFALVLVLGSSVLAAHTLAAFVGYRPPYEVEPNLFATLIALVPAALGVAAGTYFAHLRARGQVEV